MPESTLVDSDSTEDEMDSEATLRVEKVVYSPQSDLIVELKFDTIIYQLHVYSAALKTASPIWRKQIEELALTLPQPKPATRSNKRKSECMEAAAIIPKIDMGYNTYYNNSFWAFNILFQVLHQSLDVPQKVPWHTLRSIAYLADGYKCEGALLPWAIKWTAELNTETSHCTSLGYEDWLFIGTVFKTEGCRAPMGAVVANLINFLTEVNNDRDQINVKDPASPDTTFVPKALIPSMFIDAILEERNRLKTSMEESARSAVQRIYGRAKSGASSHTKLTHGCQSFECLDVSVGSLVRSLEQNSLAYLLVSHRKCKDSKSLASLHRAVAKLNIRTPHDNNKHFDHTYKKGSNAMSIGNYVSSADGQSTLKQACPLLNSFKMGKELALKSGKRTPADGLALVEKVLHKMKQVEGTS